MGSPTAAGVASMSSMGAASLRRDEEGTDRENRDEEAEMLASQEIKALSRLRSDARYAERVRSVDTGQALQMALNTNARRYYAHHEACRLLDYFHAWVHECEIGMHGLEIHNSHATSLGDVIPPWNFIWLDRYVCDPSIASINEMASPIRPISDHGVTDELGVNYGCECQDDVCDPLTCACLQRAADCYPYSKSQYHLMMASATAHADAHPTPASTTRREFMYDSQGHLKSGIARGTPIFECNKWCSCSSHCHNRVVQKGKKARLAFCKMAPNRWGITALEDLRAGTFVGTLGGELMDRAEADRRASVYQAKLRSTYLQPLDEHVIKVHVIRQMVETHLARRNELALYRRTAAGRRMLVELVTKMVDHVEAYQAYRVQRDAHVDASNDASGSAHASTSACTHSTRDQHGLIPPFLSLTPAEQAAARTMYNAYRSQAPDLSIDSALWANHTRFFTRSPNPNVYQVPVYTDDTSITRPLLAFFTSRTVHTGEHLSFNHPYIPQSPQLPLDIS